MYVFLLLVILSCVLSTFIKRILCWVHRSKS